MTESLSNLHHISPYVRLVKISQKEQLVGEWIDYDHVFTYIEQGEAQFILNGMQYELHAGDALLMPPFMLHFIQSASAVPLIQYIVHFDLYPSEERIKWRDAGIKHEEQRRIPQHETLLMNVNPISHIQPSDQLYVKRRFLTLMHLFTTDQPFIELQMKAIMLELLAIYLRNQIEQEQRHGKQTKGWSAIEQSIHFVQEHYHLASLDRSMIARHAKLSPNHLSFLFKEQLNLSLHKFVNYVRIEQAKKLMLDRSLTIGQIAERVGYTSIYSFSRGFKSMTGITASQFITMHRRNAPTIHRTGELTNDQ